MSLGTLERRSDAGTLGNDKRSGGVGQHPFVDGAINKNPKLSKFVHWLPLDLLRQ